MYVIGADKVSEYLRVAQEVAASGGIMDAHVHATEVVFQRQKYSAPRSATALDASSRLPLAVYRVGAIREPDFEDICCIDPEARNRSSELSLTAAFSHIGPALLKAHMEMSHVTAALLLPVAPPAGHGLIEQLRFLDYLRNEIPCLSIAYSLPNCVPAHRIAEAVDEAVRLLHVRAVKLHPNLSCIDPRSAVGGHRIEALLAACDQYGLPVIVHGGRSPILGAEKAATYAALESIEAVDWAATRTTVVIAHCGVYGRSETEVVQHDLPRLQRMLAKWSNLVVDTSGISSRILATILRSIDINRVIFGSDALYVPMWRAVATTLHAILLSGAPLNETFARIARSNPAARLRIE